MAEAELNCKNNNPYVCYCDQLLWKIKLRKLCWSITDASALKAPPCFSSGKGMETRSPSLPREHFHPTSLLHGLFSSSALLIFRKSFFFLFAFNAVGFLMHSLLNECTGCFWRALNLHAFLMIYKEKNFSPSLSSPLFLLLHSLFLSLKKRKKRKSNDLIHIKWNCWFVVTVL